MTKKEMKHFEKLLLAERDRLMEGIRRLEQETLYQPASDSNAADLTSYAEVGTDNFERETALRVASGESEWLQEVTDALDRVKDGTYGKCTGCKQAIPRKRLEVFPAARYCIECKSKLERDGHL